MNDEMRGLARPTAGPTLPATMAIGAAVAATLLVLDLTWLGLVALTATVAAVGKAVEMRIDRRRLSSP